MENFHVQFTNGIDRRSTVLTQPDIIFAAMAAQRWAPGAFAQPWNRVSDRTKWKIVVIAKNGDRHEEPVHID